MARNIAIRRSGTGVYLEASGRAPRAGVFCAALLASATLLACGAAATSDRYPERKRPDAPRSASDDEVLGASRQDPADTLEGSLTTEHAAPSSPHAEEHAEEAHERLEYEQCLARQNDAVAASASGAASASAAAGAPGSAAPPSAAARSADPNAAARRRPVCPPPERED